MQDEGKSMLVIDGVQMVPPSRLLDNFDPIDGDFDWF